MLVQFQLTLRVNVDVAHVETWLAVWRVAWRLVVLTIFP
jgi:hypothetical protein